MDGSKWCVKRVYDMRLNDSKKSRSETINNCEEKNVKFM